ncbi:transposase [Luteibaculum oceani]|uniref:transposase n=1 Tax=Luteibaculum oceani TaxID=1294296 RepID=UPI001CB99955
MDAYWFDGLDQLRILAEKWQHEYNYNHPHTSLGRKAPCEYKSRFPQGVPLEENIVSLKKNMFI